MFHNNEASRTVLVRAVLLSSVMAACSPDTPIPTENHMAHGIAMSSLSQSASAQALSDLRQFTAHFHDVDAAAAAQYGLFVAPPLTAADGCISDMTAGGMGYHYTRGNNLGDNSISLLDPEFLVYAPTNAPAKGGEVKRRLAALEYFIPYSSVWPGPSDPLYSRAPTLHDFPTMQDLSNVTLAPTRFGGWAIHIWLWENNPAGMFTNYNKSVPRCAGSSY